MSSNQTKLKTKSYWWKIIFPAILLWLPLLSVHAEDVIGVRVYSNLKHLSPSQWYMANISNPGSPSTEQVDGYEAVRDGRTVYVAAVNLSGSTYYTNIYLISYNENANAETTDIFNQLVSNWHFNSNVVSTTTKAQIVRDAKRINNLQDIAGALSTYSQSHQNQYPALESGSFIRGQSTSKWPSWRQTLGVALNNSNLPYDPINNFNACTSPSQPGYDPETCWNETLSQFSCVMPSFLYEYKSQTPTTYQLLTQTEIINQSNLYPVTPVSLNNNLDSHLNLTAGSLMCQAGSSTNYCGNYLVQAPEQCEVGYTRNYCNVSSECGQFLPGGKTWYYQRVTGCDNNCQWYDPYPGTGHPSQTECSDYCGGYCGDLTRQGAFEECDGTQFAQGYYCLTGTLQCSNCNITCSDGSEPYGGSCGNGSVEYPEQCDWNGYVIPTPQFSSANEQYGCNSSSTNQNKCTFNTNYINPYIPGTPYGYCGDNLTQITKGEQCDGPSSLTGWSCTLGGQIDCATAPNSNACQTECDQGCPYQGGCGNNVKESTGSCTEACDGTATPPNTICKSDCSEVLMCIDNFASCDGPLNDPNGCETNILFGTPDAPPPNTTIVEDCGACDNDCTVGSGDGFPFCDSGNCRIQCNTGFHCENSTFPYNTPDICYPGDSCVSNCGDGQTTDPEFCDDGDPLQGGHNGQVGFCNSTCTDIEGLGIALFSDNFNDFSSTTSRWEYGYRGVANSQLNPTSFSALWLAGSGLNTEKLFGDENSDNSGSSLWAVRDYRVKDAFLAQRANVSVLTQMKWSGSVSRNSIILLRRNNNTGYSWGTSSGCNSNNINGCQQQYYALWNQFTDASGNSIQIRRTNLGQLGINGAALTTAASVGVGNWWFVFDAKTFNSGQGQGNEYVRLRARWWEVGTVMPTTWDLTYNDYSSNRIISSGKTGLGIWPFVEVYYDNFKVYDAQPN